MWFHSLLASWKSGRSRGRRPQPRPARRGTRLILEHLEELILPSSYVAASASALIADINAANAAAGANTITLAAPTTAPYVLTAVNNTTNGATGLPVIAANDNLTILGNGDTIERSTAAGTPDFRLLEVAGGSLTLENLTLQGGLAQCLGVGSGLQAGPSDGGGAIFNSGTLVLNGVTVQDNMAVGPSQRAYSFNGGGGGIYAFAGSVTLEGGTIVQNNEALGGSVEPGRVSGFLFVGGNAYGGGLFVWAGRVTVTNAALDHNAAVGGAGADGGIYGGQSENGTGRGGGLYARGGMVTLTNATLVGNDATYVNNGILYGGYGGGADGGGAYLAGGITTLTNCTVQGNSALGSYEPEGGGLYVGAGALTLANCTVQGNLAGYGYGAGGSGLYIVSGATVHLDSFTVANTINNDIDGTYNLTTPAGQPPIVVNAASAAPSPVTGTTTSLSVLGSDPSGESSLDYTWVVTSAPAGAATPTFSSNGSNASQNTTATFYRAGTYTFQVTMSDPSCLTAVSSVSVTVVQTVTSLRVTPGNVTLANGKTQQFTAIALDQFGQALASQPTFTWQVSSSSGGTISKSGLYTAPKKGTGTFQVEVSADGLTAQANVTVT